MFGSSIIDVAGGLIVIYLLFSLICSAANEVIETYARRRSRDLENGLKEMLRDDDMVRFVYEHPMVNSLFRKAYTPGGKNLPSYIPSRNFALALMDIAAPKGATGALSGELVPPTQSGRSVNMQAAVSANHQMPDDLREALLTLIEANENQPEKVRQSIEDWFDSSMDRVSGGYKRRSQLIILLLGLSVAILVNVDSIALVRTLSNDRTMRDSLVAAAGEYAKNDPVPTTQSTTRVTNDCDTPQCRVRQNLVEIDKLGIPIGWTRQVSSPPDPRQFFGVSWQAWVIRLLGWLITALAISLGAPFWFDVLNKFIIVRATVKPREKSPEERSKD